MREIEITFEEIGVSNDGRCEAGQFSGTAVVDVVTGRIDRIEIETLYLDGLRWKRGNPIVGYRDLHRAGGCGAGHALLLILEPVIRRRCAGAITDAIQDYYDTAGDRRADYQRETMEALG